MTKSMVDVFQVNGQLGDFFADNVGEVHSHDNLSENVGHLDINNMGRAEATHFERLKAMLNVAFAVSDESYTALTAEEVIARNSNRQDASLK